MLYSHKLGSLLRVNKFIVENDTLHRKRWQTPDEVLILLSAQQQQQHLAVV